MNVSSNAHRNAFPGLDLDNLNSEKYYMGSGWGAYGQTKLENILFTQELQRRATITELDWLIVMTLHPGKRLDSVFRS